MQTYEVTYIVSDAVADDGVSEVMQEVTKELERLGAVIVKEEPWGRRKLAYPIKHRQFGSYVTLQAHLEPSKVVEIDRFMTLHASVLRHIALSILPQSLKTTDEAELTEAFEKRVEEKTAKKPEVVTEAVAEPATMPVEEEEVAEAAKPKSKRKTTTKTTNEAEKTEESAAERRKLVDEKLSEILGKE